jgi:hypothetical protein
MSSPLHDDVGTTINRHAGPETLALQRIVGLDWLLREKGHEVEVDIGWGASDACCSTPGVVRGREPHGDRAFQPTTTE